MSQRIAAVFGSQEAAKRAADALIDLGADREHVSMLVRGEEGGISTTTPALEDRDNTDFVEPAREVGDSGAPLTTADDEDAAAGAATGAALGAVAGLAAGAMALLVPGFGLVMAAGPLAWALGGAAGSAAAGAIAGGVYGGLRDVGIEEHHARGYEERLRSGDVLVTALIPSIAEDRVLDIMAEHGAEDVSFADDTSISRMDDSAAAARIEAAETPAAMPGHRSALDAERDIATADPAQARMDVPPPVPSLTPNMGPPGRSGLPGAGMGTTVPGTADVTPGTGTPGSVNTGLGAPRADYNEEASPADKVNVTRHADTSFEASTARPGVAPDPMNARDHTATVPSAATTSNYHSQNPDANTASYAESPVGAAATTGAAFDAHVAEGDRSASTARVTDNPDTAFADDATTARPTVTSRDVASAQATFAREESDTAFNANVARGEAKQVEGEIRDRAADRTTNPMDDLAAKAKKLEGKAQEEIGEAEETIERRRV